MRILRPSLCVLVAFSVLAFGTVEVWSESILEIAAGLLFLCWATLIFRDREMEIHWSHLYWPLLAFLGIGTLQMWLGASAYPFLTGVALLKISACSLLFFLFGQAFRSRSDLGALAWFLMCFAFVVAVFGIVQNFTAHEALYWYRPLSGGGSPFGPYVNRNDFAGLMEMLAPVGLSLMIFGGVRREQMAFVGLLTVGPIVALFLSASRGGITSFVFEVGFLAAIVYFKRSQKSKAMPFAVVLLAALVAVGWLGTNRILDRFANYHSGELTSNSRVRMDEATWRIFLDHPIWGSGLGTLVAVYPHYEIFYDEKIVDHTHNDYVEALAETGVAGGICGVVFFFLLFREARARLAQPQSSLSQGLHVAGITGCAGLMVHSLVDFNLHIPANGLVFLVMASMATAPVLIRRAHTQPSDQIPYHFHH